MNERSEKNAERKTSFPELGSLPNVGKRIHYLMDQKGLTPFSLCQELEKLGYEMKYGRVFYICMRHRICRLSTLELKAFKDYFCIEYSDLFSHPDGEVIPGLESNGIPQGLGQRIKMLRVSLGLGGRVEFASKVDIDFYRYERIERKNLDLYPEEFCRIQKVTGATWQLLIEGNQF